jgi:hypothetical protein
MSLVDVFFPRYPTPVYARIQKENRSVVPPVCRRMFTPSPKGYWVGDRYGIFQLGTFCEFGAQLFHIGRAITIIRTKYILLIDTILCYKVRTVPSHKRYGTK